MDRADFMYHKKKTRHALASHASSSTDPIAHWLIPDRPGSILSTRWAGSRTRSVHGVRLRYPSHGKERNPDIIKSHAGSDPIPHFSSRSPFRFGSRFPRPDLDLCPRFFPYRRSSFSCAFRSWRSSPRGPRRGLSHEPFLVGDAVEVSCIPLSPDA